LFVFFIDDYSMHLIILFVYLLLLALQTTTLEGILVVIHAAHSIRQPRLHLDFVQNLPKEQEALLVEEDQPMKGAVEPVDFGRVRQQEDYLATCLAIETSNILQQLNIYLSLYVNDITCFWSAAINRIKLFGRMVAATSIPTKIGVVLHVEQAHRAVQEEEKVQERELLLDLEELLDVKQLSYYIQISLIQLTTFSFTLKLFKNLFIAFSS
jgi:hypothetical protein